MTNSTDFTPKLLEVWISKNGNKYFADGREIPFSWIENKNLFYTKVLIYAVL